MWWRNPAIRNEVHSLSKLTKRNSSRVLQQGVLEHNRPEQSSHANLTGSSTTGTSHSASESSEKNTVLVSSQTTNSTESTNANFPSDPLDSLGQECVVNDGTTNFTPKPGSAVARFLDLQPYDDVNLVYEDEGIRLYLGTIDSALNPVFLAQKNIEGVVNMCGGDKDCLMFHEHIFDDFLKNPVYRYDHIARKTSGEHLLSADGDLQEESHNAVDNQDSNGNILPRQEVLNVATDSSSYAVNPVVFIPKQLRKGMVLPVEKIKAWSDGGDVGVPGDFLSQMNHPDPEYDNQTPAFHKLNLSNEPNLQNSESSQLNEILTKRSTSNLGTNKQEPSLGDGTSGTNVEGEGSYSSEDAPPEIVTKRTSSHCPVSPTSAAKRDAAQKTSFIQYYIGKSLSFYDGFDVKYLELSAHDMPQYDITQHFDTVFQFVSGFDITGSSNSEAKSATKVKRNVLIHCVMGMNRSATVLSAFLMRRNKWTARRTVDWISKRRAGILSIHDFFVV